MLGRMLLLGLSFFRFNMIALISSVSGAFSGIAISFICNGFKESGSFRIPLSVGLFFC